jgi:hypothetical protein
MSNQGRFTWYELMSTDPAAGLDFYAGLTGWTHMPFSPGGEDAPPYWVWMKGEQPMAGCMELPAEAAEQGAPTHWLGYIHCDDVDATKARAIELGAQELMSTEIPSIGKFAVMHDPQQAVIAFFQPESEPMPEEGPGPGRFSWHELMAGDYEAAWSFYSELFGWEIIDDMDMGEAGVYRIFGRNGTHLGGMFNKPAEVPICAWLYYISVPSVDEAATALVEAGGKVIHGPMEVPGGDKIIQALDPQGGYFALHSLAQAAEEA